LWKITEVQIETPEHLQELGQLLGIGQNEQGELYLLTKAPGLGASGNTGRVYRLLSAD
jgi:hypothetical protein